MKKLTLLLVAVSLFVASPAMAEEQRAELETTYYLFGACMDAVYQDDTLTTSAYCRAFIKGTVNTHKYYTSYYNFPKQYCLPKALSERKIVGIFIKFVQVHPEFMENSALATLHHALKNAFTCTEPESLMLGSSGTVPKY
jgi:hypothetical protein